MMYISFDEFLDAVVSVTDRIDGFEEWDEDRKMRLYEVLAKIMRPPSLDLREIFQIQQLPSKAVEFSLDSLSL